jgi:hypothetical protein
LQDLFERRLTFRKRRARQSHPPELLRRVSAAEAQHDASDGDPVNVRHLTGQNDRMAKERATHQGPEADSPGTFGQ